MSINKFHYTPFNQNQATEYTLQQIDKTLKTGTLSITGSLSAAMPSTIGVSAPEPLDVYQSVIGVTTAQTLGVYQSVIGVTGADILDVYQSVIGVTGADILDVYQPAMGVTTNQTLDVYQPAMGVTTNQTLDVYQPAMGVTSIGVLGVTSVQTLAVYDAQNAASNSSIETILFDNIYQDALLKENNQKYYMKGALDIDGTNSVVIGSIADIELPPNIGTTVQLSSQIIGVTHQVVLTGLDVSLTPTAEVITMNGQTPVIAGDVLRRITGLRVITDDELGGEIYVSRGGTPLSNGIPATDIYAILPAPDLVWNAAQVTIPSTGTTAVLKPQYVAYSVANTTNAFVEIDFQMKPTNRSQWYTEMAFKFTTDTHNAFSWPLDGIPDIPNPTIGEGYDFRLVAFKSSTGAAYVSAAMAIEQK